MGNVSDIGGPARMPAKRTLVAFDSGHYKEVKGNWTGDSVWMHFKKENGGTVHVNKDKVEYVETFDD